ncbi:S8 family serine peptidase [Fluviispira multicolorata]|uniref:S8 family serine peptidase n=1 Tax=Fluviispira multicolorata TaxID=2654512 RepID=A0A833JE27_9BACT|nr:S8 family serine peptidase [Fluviispira multicolorata]KAB8031052.1 S8 family serine peptidase [Fluviispira multicolorata]
MILNKKQISLFSVPVIAISFLSSCGKTSHESANLKSNGFSKAELGLDLNSETNSAANKRKKFCTDLDNAKLNPLGQYQWHLKNTGQKAFASEAGIAGEDINVADVLKKQCLSGNGIRVAVVDSGMEVDHQSLRPNIENKEFKTKTWSINFRDNRLASNDPSPIADDEVDHGTMVAGIIGMRSNLGFGGSGVAPRVKLSAYNVISDGAQSFENFIDALGGSDASKENDIFNMSYGFSNAEQMEESHPLIASGAVAFRYGARQLRDGKGALYVKSAGNGFQKLSYDFRKCLKAIELNISCQNSNMNLLNAMPEVIVAGALNAKGTKSSYSTTGASLWVSSPGGEYGVDKEWVEDNYARFSSPINWKQYRATIGEPAIITTDFSGTRYGMSKMHDANNLEDIINIRNQFNALDTDENLDGNYTNTMNGTSSAAPVTSGSLALILEANPNLTWRDVKYILAKTSTKVDPNLQGTKVELVKGEVNSAYQVEQGWVANAAGFSYSNWYGFGRVNVGEAVKLAKNYDASLGNYREWSSQYYAAKIAVPKADPKGVDAKINIPNRDGLNIESIQIQVSAESTNLGDLGLEITSPSGTKSIIWNVGNGFAYSKKIKNMTMQSNAFYGEKSEGVWTLKVINAGFYNSSTTFNGWKIMVTGHK